MPFFLFIADLNVFRPRTRIPMLMPHLVRRRFYLRVCDGIDRVRVQVVCSTIMASQSSRLDERVLFSCDLKFDLFSSSTTLSSLVSLEVMSFFVFSELG